MKDEKTGCTAWSRLANLLEIPSQKTTEVNPLKAGRVEKKSILAHSHQNVRPTVPGREHIIRRVSVNGVGADYVITEVDHRPGGRQRH
jgi:hypothetical protein